MTEADNERRKAAANIYAKQKGDDCLCQRTSPGTPVGEHVYIFCGCNLAEAVEYGCQHEAAHHAEEIERARNSSAYWGEQCSSQQAELAALRSELASRDVEISALEKLAQEWQQQFSDVCEELALVKEETSYELLIEMSETKRLLAQLQVAREGLEFLKDRFEFHHKDRDGRVVAQNLLSKLDQMAKGGEK